MVKTIGGIALGLAACFGTAVQAGAQDLTAAQREVWQRVESRWQAWQEGDFAQMLNYYHARFHRWNVGAASLGGRDALLARWHRQRTLETVISHTLEPRAIDVFGNFAAVHYISRETVRFTAEAPPVLEGRVKAGETFEWPIRWSDYLVKEEGRWLFIGGSRDGSCAIFDRAPFTCRRN